MRFYRRVENTQDRDLTQAQRITVRWNTKAGNFCVSAGVTGAAVPRERCSRWHHAVKIEFHLTELSLLFPFEGEKAFWVFESLNAASSTTSLSSCVASVRNVWNFTR